MKKYLLRFLILLLIVPLYVISNRFLDKKERDFSRPHVFTFRADRIPDRFFETQNLDRENFRIAFVVISGSFSGWSSDDPTFLMTQVSNQTWQKTLSLDKARNPYKYVLYPVKPGKKLFSDYHYSEGYWVEDLNASLFEDDSFGGVNSVHIVRSNRLLKSSVNFLLYALGLGLIALTLLEVIVRWLMHAPLSLKSKLILVFGVLLVFSNLFFIYYTYRQNRDTLRQTQVDKINMIHSMLLGEGVNFFLLTEPQTRGQIRSILDRFFVYSSLQDNYDLFSNTRHPLGRICILDNQGIMQLYSLEPSQAGFLGYWLKNDTNQLAAYLRLISDYAYSELVKSGENPRHIYSLSSSPLFQGGQHSEIPAPLTGKSPLLERLFFPYDHYLYPIYYKYQPVGYYLVQIYPRGYSGLLYQMLLFNLILLLILSGLYFLLVRQLGTIILDPLHQLITGIKKVQEGNYAYEISADTQDEIKTLADAYNYLREYQDYSRRKVEHYTRHLEDIVEDRTRELKILNAKLTALDETKSRFFSNISHDLRTPLTLILAPIEYILEEEVTDPGEIRSHLEIIRRNSLRLLKLINNLLDFSRLDAGRLEPRFQPLNVVQPLEFLVSTLNSAAERRQLHLELQVSASRPVIYADGEMFEKIIMNLLSNAFKFTPPQGTIRLEVWEDDTALYILVSDTGVGIPEDKLSHIFERFAQVDNSEKREFEGSGIGLSLVRELMDLHRGTIQVESSSGKGARFTLKFLKGRDHLEDRLVSELPLEENPVMRDYLLADFQSGGLEDKNHGRGGAESLPVPELLSGSTILVAEDQEDMRSFIRSLLESNFRVIEARDGQEAWEILSSSQPDLVISDVMMPRRTGLELCQALKSDPLLRHIPIILLTARIDENTRITSLENHADDYLAKPFNTRELLARVNNLLLTRRLEIQLMRRQQEIEQDLAQAALVQQSILTSSRQIRELRSLEIALRYLPMSGNVSGDYYNLHSLRNGRATITVADTAGHGLQAALSTMQLDVLVRESQVILNQPDERLHYLNRLFMNELRTRNFLTVFNIDIFDDLAVFSSAGHPPQILVRTAVREIIALNAPGPALGSEEGSEYQKAHQVVSPGDILILFTDGLYEEFSPGGEEFGDDRLFGLIKAWLEGGRLDAMTMEALCDSLLEQLREYHQGERYNDDVTMIAIRIL